MSTPGDESMLPAMLWLFERRLALLERRTDFYDGRLQLIEASRSRAPAPAADPIMHLATRTSLLEARVEELEP